MRDGANIKVLQVIQGQHIPALTEGSDGGAYFARDASRRAPHNLYTDGNRLAQGVSKYAPKVTYVLPSAGEPAASRPLGSASMIPAPAAIAGAIASPAFSRAALSFIAR